MTPAEELRAAATRLREMAKATAGGKWTAEYLGNHNAWWVTHDSKDEDGSTTWGTVADLESIDMAGNAAWIALMGPDKAGPLAAWLEACVKQRCIYADAMDPEQAAALAFARSILHTEGEGS